jgi:hypothetical protein
VPTPAHDGRHGVGFNTLASGVWRAPVEGRLQVDSDADMNPLARSAVERVKVLTGAD